MKCVRRISVGYICRDSAIVVVYRATNVEVAGGQYAEVLGTGGTTCVVAIYDGYAVVAGCKVAYIFRRAGEATGARPLVSVVSGTTGYGDVDATAVGHVATNVAREAVYGEAATAGCVALPNRYKSVIVSSAYGLECALYGEVQAAGLADEGDCIAVYGDTASYVVLASAHVASVAVGTCAAELRNKSVVSTCVATLASSCSRKACAAGDTCHEDISGWVGSNA